MQVDEVVTKPFLPAGAAAPCAALLCILKHGARDWAPSHCEWTRLHSMLPRTPTPKDKQLQMLPQLTSTKHHLQKLHRSLFLQNTAALPCQ